MLHELVSESQKEFEAAQERQASIQKTHTNAKLLCSERIKELSEVTEFQLKLETEMDFNIQETDSSMNDYLSLEQGNMVNIHRYTNHS